MQSPQKTEQDNDRGPVLSTYSAAELKRLRGTFMDRCNEYRFAVAKAFHNGLFRQDSPVLDVGCGDPFKGLFRFLVEFNWRGYYVGMDAHIPADAMERQSDEPRIPRLYDKFNLDNPGLQLPFSRKNPIKQFAVAYCIEVLEHVECQEELILEMQRCAATVVVTAPHPDFKHWRPTDPTHKRSLSVAQLEGWGFQDVGYVNFNGRTGENGGVFHRDNGDPAKCSEVWGVWRDARAEILCRQRDARGVELVNVEGGMKWRRMADVE